MSMPTYFFQSSAVSAKDRLEGKFASPDPQGGIPTGGDKAVPLIRYAGQFWFVEVQGEHQAWSTEEVAHAMDTGRTVRAVSGPFGSRKEAGESLERYWEMLADDEEDDE